MFWIFSEAIESAINKVNMDNLREIRIRNGMPIRIAISNKWGYLTKNGFSVSAVSALIAGPNEAQSIAVKASENSLYSVCDNIAHGFLTLKNGLRIGLCGEAVNNDGRVKTFKNFSSVTVRIPHEILGASDLFFNHICQGEKIMNSLIISPPGGGKTTVLRDLAKRLSTHKNTLIIDERYELAGVNNGSPTFNVGECDIISGCNKSVAIENAIRSCAPDIIITDEISGCDYYAIRQAVSGGVAFITSIHSDSIENLLKKPDFDKFFSDKIFDRFIVLQGRDNPGKCKGVYDRDLNGLL